MAYVRKIKAGLVKVSVNDFVGEDGNVFFDVDDGIMRLSDGTTPGGIPLSSGGAEGGASTFRQLLDTPSSFSGAGGNFVKVNPQASALEFVDVDLFDGDYNSLTNTPTLFDPSSIDQSLLPDTDVTYDLGSTTKKWRDLYLSGSTIYLGDTVIRNIDGTVELPANAKVNGKKIPTDISELDDVNDILTGVGSGVTSYNELTDLPTLFSGNYNDLTNKPTIPADISDLTDNSNLLAGVGGDGNYTLPIASNTVLGGIKIGNGLTIDGSGVVSLANDHFDGSYNSLTDTPDLSVYQLSATAFSGSYTDLTDTPTLFSGAYADLTGAPTIPADVSDLTDTTNLLNHFSGSYNDLTDKPTIPTVPTTISAFTNDSGYITGYTVTQADVTQHQAALTITESQISDLGAYLTSVAFTDLTATPTTLAGYGITDAFDGAYSSLTGAPTTVSSFTNDAGYLTTVAYADLTGLPTTLAGYGITDAYTTAQVDSAITTAVNEILGDAPELLDTLGEIADAVGDDANFVTTINTAISLKANTADLATVATTGSYTDLSNTPTVPTDVSELTDNTNLLAASSISEDDLFTYAIIF